MKFSNIIFLSSTLAILTGFPIESNAFAFQPLNSIAQPTKSPFLQASKLHFYDNHFKSPSSSSTIRTKLYTTQDDQDDQDNEIERLKAMAAQLRSEAAKLEVSVYKYCYRKCVLCSRLLTNQSCLLHIFLY